MYNKNISYVIAYIGLFPRDDAWPMFFMYTREYLGYASYLIGV